MFASNRSPRRRRRRHVVRLPYAALASREHGAHVADASVQAAVAVATAVAAERPADADAEARARVAGGARAAFVRVPRPRQPQRWEHAEPGAALGSRLERVDAAECDDYELVQVITAFERQKAHLAAFQARAIAELAGREIYAACTSAPDNGCDPHDTAKAAAQEVSVALRWTPGRAAQQVYQAVALEQQCPATLAALGNGEIDEYRARIIVEETAPLAHDPAARARAEAEVLAEAGEKTGPQVRALARRRVLAADPEVAERRREQARHGRRVTKPRPELDGMAGFAMVGPAEDVTAFYTALDSAARARKAEAGEGRSLDQLRFDVLADLGWSALQAGHLGCCDSACLGGHRTASRHGQAATVHVTVPFSTLAGIDNAPAEQEGYGPITAEVARAIAAHGTLRRLLTDPAAGRLLDFGQTRYEPPRHLAEHIIARDRTCRLPTCNWRAAACDLDHTLSFREGGATSEANLGPLHRGDHNGKTHHGWRLLQPESGRFIWISPAGHLYHVDPEAIGRPIIADDHGPPDGNGPPGEHDPPDRLDPPPF